MRRAVLRWEIRQYPNYDYMAEKQKGKIKVVITRIIYSFVFHTLLITDPLKSILLFEPQNTEMKFHRV